MVKRAKLAAKKARKLLEVGGWEGAATRMGPVAVSCYVATAW